jgi:hypothetical protein
MTKKSENPEKPEGAQVITEEDLTTIRQFIRRANIDTIGEDMRKVVEEYMPELDHKLPSREQQVERHPPMPPEQRQMHHWKDRLVPYTVSGRQRKKGDK